MAELNMVLTSAELVYLVKERSGELLPGISDPFRDLDESGKTRLSLDVEDSLQERGYRKRAFGGKTAYDPELLALVDLCVGFQHYIGFDYRKAQGQLVTERFYDCGGTWLQISGGSDALSLMRKKPEDVRAALEQLPMDSGSRSDEVSMLVPMLDFKSIGRLIQRGKLVDAQNEIANLELDAFSQKFLLDGLSFMTDFATITLVARGEDGISADSVSALIGDDAMAEFYQNVGEDNRTMIGLRAASAGSWVTLKGVAEEWLTA